ncbi:MAG: hypothetical protein ACOYBM_07865 [Dethiobacteria bacterium]|jgi:uncharacterized membrane protein|nr:hypothetical protein [Bacillota bacterium]
MLKGYGLRFIATVFVLVVLLLIFAVYILYRMPQAEDAPKRSRPVWQSVDFFEKAL